MVNKILYTVLLLSISLKTFSQDDVNDNLKEIELVANIEKVITLDFVPSSVIKIANENLVAYQLAPQKKQILLTGIKAGDTTLTVRDLAGDIRVRYLLKVIATDQSKIVAQLKELIGDVEGLEIGIKGDSVYVGGQIVVPADIGKVVVVLAKYPDVLRLVELSPQTQLIIAKKMQDEIQKSGLKDITVRVVNGSYWIEGVVNSAGERDKLEQIAKAYLPDQIQNLARREDAVQTTKKLPYEIIVTINAKEPPAPIPKLFKLTAQFVELTKAYDRTFGFSWTPTIGSGGGEIQVGKSGSGGVSTSSQGTLAATISNLFPKLNSAKSAGHARVVQSGVVIVKEGIEGIINKSTTINYALGTGENLKTGQAKAGFEMKITPKMLQEEKINLKIGISIKATDGGTAPVELDNSVTTEIVVKSAESAVVGGVVSNKFTTDFDRDPPTSEQIEGGYPLFSFLKSKKYSTNRSQFVIFVTPEIIESAATGAQDIERKFRKRSR
ncbi:MAG: pilus assembly protein N-terminal domain-containing protein [Bdellovibrionales bacterium]|nr:pilus assembly protein N-terminal domain-containing protein [Bdellovibrionales bacterium]